MATKRPNCELAVIPHVDVTGSMRDLAVLAQARFVNGEYDETMRQQAAITRRYYMGWMDCSAGGRGAMLAAAKRAGIPGHPPEPGR